MANTPILRPLPNSLRFKPKGQVLLRPEASPVWLKGGDYEEFKLTADIEESEVYSNEFPEKRLALLDITKAEPTLSFTARMMTQFLRQVAFLSSPGLSFAQIAAADQEFTAQAAVDNVIQLPHRATTVAGVKIGGQAATAGAHFKVDVESGLVDVLAFPAGAVETDDGFGNVVAAIEIEYAAAATAGTRAYGLMSNTDIRCAVKFVANQKWGPQHELTLHTVQIRPDGDIVLGADGDDFSTMGFTGRCYADTSQPAGFELGTILERSTRLAA